MEIIMIKKALTLAVLTTLIGCTNEESNNNTAETVQATPTTVAPLVYPATKKGEAVDTYFEQNRFTCF